MWEYVAVGVLVAAAALLVIRRLVKGVSGGHCSSCDNCAESGSPSCDDDEPPRDSAAPGNDAPTD